MIKVKNNNKLKTKHLILYNLFLFIFLLSLFLFYKSWTHSLSKNNNWQSSKTVLEKGVMGAWSFMLTYRALADNHLDIGTWHGYQELFYKKPVDVEKLSFDFKLSKESYFTFFFSGNNDTLEGIRISNDPKFPGMLLRVYKWKFLEKRPLTNESLTDEWHHFRLQFNGDDAVIQINEKPLVQLTENSYRGNIIGFRGCEKSILIDNITVKEYSSNEFHDDFGIKYSNAFYIFLLFLIFNLGFLLIYKMRTFFLIGMINVAVVFLFLMLFFTFYGQYRYPKEWMINWNSLVSKIENQNVISEKIEKSISTEINKENLTIMFLGSSQTWGAGATTEEKTFIRRFEKLLNYECRNVEVQCVNAGISGVNSNDLLKFYKERWIKTHPDYLIINLSFNDAGNELFRQNIEQIITINKQQNIKTVLVLEPIATYNKYHALNNDILIALAKQYDLQIIDMHNYMLNHLDDGFVYWDFIHLTDFGQTLFANKLFNEIGIDMCSKAKSNLKK